MSKILRPDGLAEHLHVSERLIRTWQLDKVIPYIKIGRTTLFEVEKVMVALERFERNSATAQSEAK